jgi:hypothetical protein
MEIIDRGFEHLAGDASMLDRCLISRYSTNNEIKRGNGLLCLKNQSSRRGY